MKKHNIKKLNVLLGRGLWSKNFTILTFGSVVSLLGCNAVSMVMGLYIVDSTSSTLMYSIFTAARNFVAMLIPALVAPFIEKHSKVKEIYSLDFITGFMLLIVALISRFNMFSVMVAIVFSVIYRAIYCSYIVAYTGITPYIVRSEYYSKANSVAAMLSNMAGISALVGTFAYNQGGFTYILFFGAVCYIIAAAFETRINVNETASTEVCNNNSFITSILSSYKDVFFYLKGKKGIIALVILQFFFQFGIGASDTLMLPLFKLGQTRHGMFGLDGNTAYIVASAFYCTGFAWGSTIDYFIMSKVKNRYALYSTLFIVTLLTYALYAQVKSPVLMFILLLLCGITSIMINCLYETVLCESIDKEKYSRFIGFSNSLYAMAGIVGNLAAGILSEAIGIKNVMMISMIPALISLIILIAFKGNVLSSLFRIRTSNAD